MTAARIVAVLVLLGVTFGAGYSLGTRIKQGEWDAARLAAKASAEQTERNWQDDAQVAQEMHDEELRAVNDRLADALERLRARPGRMPEASVPACNGATGAQLSGPDAAFLEREAARADSIAADLEACRAWVEAVTK